MGLPYSSLLSSDTLSTPVIRINGGAGTIEIAIDPIKPHCFAAVEFYSDAEGASVITPATGTLSFTLQLPVLPSAPQSFVNNVIDAADRVTVSWDASATKCYVALAGITKTSGSTNNIFARLRVQGAIS